ncbi:AMP-binding protein [Gordonia sp. ABSL1-1]|uniref:class I adenylate-forming enzyme family protein n=1 Tax=Gordonia sp. ABSL1-1 TaxID=3053923 RepID=UPI002573D76C|nr:AMP-binding protein [Gordonia sp. ABSL1-1]MDL9935435.1 AMP-binding protein [Gordonia sp. ABSL1-1]
MTIGEQITSAARRFPATPVIFTSDTRPEQATTLEQLYADAQRVAAGLRAAGVGRGSVIAVQLPNWRECVVAHSAGWLLGATVLPIVSIYGPAELDFIMRSSRARVYIGAASWRGRDGSRLFETAAAVPGLDLRYSVGGPITGARDFEDLSVTGPGVPDVADADADDVALLVYTSGTTAEPKGVRHTHRTLLGEIAAMVQMRQGGPEVSCLAAFPSGHVAGVLGIVRLLTRGTLTVLMDAWDPAAAVTLIETHRIQASAGAPIHLAAILDAAERRGADITCLSEYTTGAANVSADLIRRADAVGVRAFRCYGSTEHPTISSGTTDDPLDKRAGTDGRITPGTQVRIVDDTGREVDADVDGEILTRGPEQFVGYTSAALNTEAFADGWFRTGDIGRIDDDGYLRITDRKKDIIVRGGENLSSKEIEDVLLAHPDVAEAAAVGAPDERYGERVCAFIVPRADATIDLDSIRRHFADRGLACQKTPERLEVVTALPRTASGKVQKPTLRDRLATRHRGELALHQGPTQAASDARVPQEESESRPGQP